MTKGNLLEDVKHIEPLLRDIPKHWDAKTAIMEMKNNNYEQWKQMEWIGFYFQYLCEKRLKNLMQLQKPRYGKTSFDGLLSCAWDFKAHPINNDNHDVPANDREATEKAISEYGSTGVILALGKITYNDEDRSFQKWHEKLKGGKSEFEKQRIERGAWSRLRKMSFDLEEIVFIKINGNTLKKCGSFQEGFRNSDGSPRRVKILLKLNKLTAEIVRSMTF
ncbi:MAG: hypothetical protein AAB361_02760 [Patescibacteria group bacterium]